VTELPTTLNVAALIRFFDPLSPPEKAGLAAKMERHHFQAGEKLLTQGEKNDAIHFVFMGVIQVTHQVTDGRNLGGTQSGSW
jgi:CRP-like cAMP-binding protein